MTPQSKGDKDHHWALRRLEVETSKIQEKLTQATGGESSSDIIIKAFELLLDSMSTALYDCAREYCEVGDESHSFYFWPGFESRLLRSRLRLTVPEPVIQGLKALGYKSEIIRTGVCLPPEPDKLQRTTIYYDALLEQAAHDENAIRQPFSVGGTHNWLFWGDPVKARDPFTSALGRLEILEVTLGDSNEIRQLGSGALQVCLSREDVPSWGPTISRFLNCSQLVETPAPKLWPLPVPLAGEALTDYFARLERARAGEGKEKEYSRFREEIYSIWLAGCFLPNPETLLDEAWVGALVEEIAQVDPERAMRMRQLSALERSVCQQPSASPFIDRHFLFWTNLSLPQPLALTRLERAAKSHVISEVDLGSAMFLTDFQLPVPFLIAARQWIYSFYLVMRHLETEYFEAEAARERERSRTEKQLRAQQSHAVGTEIVYIKSIVSSLATLIDQTGEKTAFSPDSVIYYLEQARLESEHLDRSLMEVAKECHYSTVGTLSALERKMLISLVGEIEKSEVSAERLIASANSLLGTIDNRADWSTIKSLAASAVNELVLARDQNRAFLRIQDHAMTLDLGRVKDRSLSLSDMTRRALVVALTVFFEGSYPSNHARGEGPYCEAAGYYYHKSDAKAQDAADAWRRVVFFEGEGKGLDWHQLKSWLNMHIHSVSHLTLELEGLDSPIGLKALGEPEATKIFSTWLEEAILNALKYCRSFNDKLRPAIRIAVKNEPCIGIEISNTVQSGAETGVASPSGHFGIEFLRYAAQRLFPSCEVFVDFTNEQGGQFLVRLSRLPSLDKELSL